MRYTWLACLIALSVPADAQQAPTIIPKLSIGCESCGGPPQFNEIRDISITAAGEVLVTDREPPILRRFDAAGRPVWNGGTRGRGPGEYLLPIRAALIDRGVIVVDMTNSRVTELTPSGTVRGSIMAPAMPMAAGVNSRGDVWIGSDDFRDTLRLYQRRGDSLVISRRIGNSTPNLALAVAPDGSIAIMPASKRYEIIRFDARGTMLPPITRDVPQARRTPLEEAEFRERLRPARGMAAAEATQRGGRAATPVFRPEDLGLKDHLRIDGLRFDASGRLWVLTQRGNESSAVIDVFSSAGAFLGAVTIPARVTAFALGGTWLATAGEDQDGIPIVKVWTVRWPPPG